MPCVSVIINFLNSKRYLVDSIDSVLHQTFKDWELLLVDDGSTDKSTEIALSYANRYPDRVRYLTHEGFENRGAAASRNLGMRSAQGEFVAFLDSDDVWLPNKLEEQVGVLRTFPQAAMVYGPGYFFYDTKSDHTQRDFMQALGVDGNRLIEPPSLFYLFIRNFNITPSPSGILVRQEPTKNLNGFVEDFRGIYQVVDDQVFYAKITLHHPVYVDTRCWYHYRLHADSCGAQTKDKKTMYQAQVKFSYWLKEYVGTLPNFTSRQVSHRVDHYLWESLMHEIMTRQYSGHRIIGPLKKRVDLCQEMVSGRRKNVAGFQAQRLISIIIWLLLPYPLVQLLTLIRRDGLLSAGRRVAQTVSLLRG